MCTKKEQLAARRERDLGNKKSKYHVDPEKKRDVAKKRYKKKEPNILKIEHESSVSESKVLGKS